MKTEGPPYVAVVGPGEPGAELLVLAEEVGQRLGAAGAVLICGGLTGVMEAACRGAQSAGGLTVGLLPGAGRSAANPHVSVAIPTGLGEARNVLVVRSADAVVCVGGSWGTLSEVALAVRTNRPAVILRGWRLRDAEGAPVDHPSLTHVRTPEEAVQTALAAIGHPP